MDTLIYIHIEIAICANSSEMKLLAHSIYAHLLLNANEKIQGLLTLYVLL